MKKILFALLLMASSASAQTVTRGDVFLYNLSLCKELSDATDTTPEGRVVATVCTKFTQKNGDIYTKKTGTGNTGWVLISAGGTVTSVGLAMPSQFAVTNSPVTTSGTLTAAWNNQPANSVFAANGGAPAFSATPTVTSITTTGTASIGGNTTLAANVNVSQPYALTTATGGGIKLIAPTSGQTFRLFPDASYGGVIGEAYASGAYVPFVLKSSTVKFTGAGTFDSTLAVTGNTNVSGYVGHPSYASQTSYWRIDNLGAADFRYLFVDEMHAKIFIADLEQALAGMQIIAKSVGQIYSDFACPAAPGIGVLYVNDLPGAVDMQVFQSGDYVVVRTFSRASGSLTVADCVGVVTSPDTTPSGYQSWVFTRVTGETTTGGGTMVAGTLATAGGLALDYGVSGNGAVETSAVDGAYATNSPYTQVKTWSGTSPASGNWTTQTRVGQLKGLTGTAEWGAIFGPYSAIGGQFLRLSNQNFEARGLALKLFNGTTEVIRLDPATSSLAMGATLPTLIAGSGFFAGLDAGCMKVHIGDHTSNYIDWNCSQLTVSGNIVVVGTSIDASSVNGYSGTNVVSAAQRSLLGLDSIGNLNPVPFATAHTPPSASGLFIGSTEMGYFASSAWKTYIDSSGNFYLGGTSGPLQWASGTSTLTIAHSAGTAGGWTVAPTSLADATGAVGMSSAVTAGNDIRFWAGNATPTSAPFRVYEDGAVVATSATITGAVTANTGYLGGAGGWVIGAGLISATNAKIGSNGTTGYVGFGSTPPTAYGNNVGAFLGYDTTAKLSLYADAGNYFQWTGAGLQFATANTTLTAAGHFVTTDAAIGGWNLSATAFTDAAATVGMSSAVTGGDDIRFWAGNATPASAPFKVTEAGSVSLNSGSFGNGGVVIGSTGIAVDGGGTITAGSVSMTTGGVNIATASGMEAGRSYKFDTGGGMFASSASGLYLLGSTGSSSYLELFGSYAELSGTKVVLATTGGDIELYPNGGNVKIFGAIYWDAASYTTTGSDYPIVYSSSTNLLSHKTNGFDGASGCGAGVADVSAEKGIITGVTCTSPNELLSLHREVNELREQLAQLLRGIR